MDNLTTHTAALYQGTRWALESCATYDAQGDGWCGGGLRLEEQMRDTYRAESDALLNDLAAVGGMLSPDDAGKLADRLAAIAGELRYPADTGQRVAEQEWTADYSQGGRPITGEAPLCVDDGHPGVDLPPAPDLARGADQPDDEHGSFWQRASRKGDTPLDADLPELDDAEDVSG